MFVFAHLEKVYSGRAWVILDGDAKGKEVVDKLRNQNQTWPENHFRTFGQPNFERYYPDQFKDQINNALNEPNKDRRTQLKHELLADVLRWTNEDEPRARQAFEASADQVITILKEIEIATMEAPVVADAAIALSTPPTLAWEQDFTQDDQTGPPINFTNVQTITYRVKPGEGCNMWRFGLKFSSSEEFGQERYSDRYPLWHLTKDHGQDSLYVTYYDENRQSTGNALTQGTYHGDEVAVRADVMGNELRIRVDGTPGYERRFPLATHLHALPSAWADGSPLALHVVAG